MNTGDIAKKITAEHVTRFDVPVLPPDRSAVASVQSIALVKSEDAPDVMRITIKRNLSVKIRSCTFRYRFSNLPIYVPDAKHPFNSFVYNEEDINESAQITFNGTVSNQQMIEGCSAYISEIILANGQLISYEPTDYRFLLRPKKKQTGSSDFSDDLHTERKPTEMAPPTAPVEGSSSFAASGRSSGKGIRRVILLTAFIFIMLAEAVAGVYVFRYMRVKNSADALMNDIRYNEAYKLVSETDYAGLLQRVCEKASVYYSSIGDLESSYVYAMGAPDPFPDTVIDYAAQSVVNIATGAINENAFRVAKMTENDFKFDGIIVSLSESLQRHGDYANALRVVSELRDEGARQNSADRVFKAALAYYIGAHRYEAVVSFLDEMDKDHTFQKPKAEMIRNVIECCTEQGDHAGLIYFTDHYPDETRELAAKAEINAGDAGIRANFSLLYPKLTAEQKRAYHAQPIAVWNGTVTQIDAGVIKGTNIKDAVSVEKNSDMTMVLRKNGSVELVMEEGKKAPFKIPAYADVVQIALGEGHAVLLHAGGTVSAYGDNSEGQCDVSAWKDIAAVAVGQKFTVGLKTDGTLVSTGSGSCDQTDVRNYRNVVDVAACNQTTIVLFADGTAAVQGYRSFGLAEVETLSGIRRMRAGGAVVLCEMNDGKIYLCNGQADGKNGTPQNWRGITAFDVGTICIAGVDHNGAMYYDSDAFAVK